MIQIVSAFDLDLLLFFFKRDWKLEDEETKQALSIFIVLRSLSYLKECFLSHFQRNLIINEKDKKEKRVWTLNSGILGSVSCLTHFGESEIFHSLRGRFLFKRERGRPNCLRGDPTRVSCEDNYPSLPTMPLTIFFLSPARSLLPLPLSSAA